MIQIKICSPFGLLSSGNVNADTVRTRPLLPCLCVALHGGMKCVHAGGLPSFVD